MDQEKDEKKEKEKTLFKAKGFVIITLDASAAFAAGYSKNLLIFIKSFFKT